MILRESQNFSNNLLSVLFLERNILKFWLSAGDTEYLLTNQGRSIMGKFQLTILLFLISFSILFSQTKINFNQLGDFNDGVAPVKKGDLWGFIDVDGKVVVEPVYAAGFDVPVFANGLCGIYSPKDDARGYINTKGEVVIPFTIYSTRPFYDTITVIYQPGDASGASSARVSIIDMKGNVLIEYAPTAYSYETHFVDGLARILKDFKSGFMDKTGKIIIETKYDDARDFSEGLAAVQFTNSLGETKWGYVDKEGNVKIDFMFQNEPTSFNSGRAFILGTNNKWGIIDNTGKVIVEPKYQQIFPYENGFATVSIMDEKWQTTYEIIDVNGKPVKKFEKDKKGNQTQLHSGFKNGLAVAMQNYKYGLIDTKGNIIVKCEFRKLNPMNDDRAYAEKFDEKTKKVTTGYIDKKGKFVIVNEAPAW